MTNDLIFVSLLCSFIIGALVGACALWLETWEQNAKFSAVDGRRSMLFCRSMLSCRAHAIPE